MMNILSTAYLFYEVDQTSYYTYDDYTKEIFQKASKLISFNQGLVVHRDAELIYYIFIKRVYSDCKNDFVGIAIQLNGVFLDESLNRLYLALEDKIDALIQEKDIFCFNNNLLQIKEDHDTKGKALLKEYERLVNQTFCHDFADKLSVLPPIRYDVTEGSLIRKKLWDKSGLAETDMSNASWVVVDSESGSIMKVRKVIDREESDLKKTQKGKKKKRHIFIKVFLAFLLPLVVGMAITVVDSGVFHSTTKQENKSLSFRDCKELGCPIYVESVDFANLRYNGTVVSDYGEPISQEESRYIRPKISYISILPYEDAELKVLFIDPDGNLLSNYYSPSDASYNKVINSDSRGRHTMLLPSWGDRRAGSYWKEGEYSFVLLYKDAVLIHKKFTVQ